MITVKQALKNPELMIKYKDRFKNIKVFKNPWLWVFINHPHLYREFSDRFDEMDGVGVTFALRDDPTLAPDLKDYLYKMSGTDIAATLGDTPTLVLDFKDHLHKIERWNVVGLLEVHPKLSLCMKYRDHPDKIEALHYVGHPHESDNLNKEEKREMGKKIIELLQEEKT